ncbi:DUF5518 domain-containing protein [Halosolutus gelatinilyticus]|uniref:DUF5518 domain-containing protein n=1 Tax=Halosolutus gelatinilyticus TaxID=2931975 RepID=UPI001FF1D7F5|nr:DUF5518 domain-containing protein [Halosolutus gelatinilyticus]
MVPLRALPGELTDESVRFAILVGLASVPFTVGLSWQPSADDAVVTVGGRISSLPLLLAGLLVGFRYRRRAVDTRRAGVWAGLVAAIGPGLVYAANAVATVRSESSELAALAVVSTVGSIAIGAVLSVFVVTAGAVFADWVLPRLDRDRRAVDARDDIDRPVADSRWWLVVAAYALAAPACVGAIVLGLPDDGVGFAFGLLGLAVLGPLAIVALVGLFIEVTAPRGRDGWIPNAWAYVGVPIGAYVLAAAGASLQSARDPSGYGIAGFVVALWIAAVVYLVRRRRHSAALSIRRR